MLKKLQRKFVLLTTLISVIVMLLIAIAINIINYNSIISYSDEVLEILVNDDFGANQGAPPHPRVTREFAFTTRFFIVHSNENDDVSFVDTKNISSITSEEAINYTEIVNKSEKNSGIIDDYRYIKTENAHGYTYIFLDIEEDIIGFENYMMYSVLIASLAVVLIFILACMLSKKAVSPIVLSYEKQKRFITDVSHEFKTPLAIIKANCDVISIIDGDSEWTESIKSQISRLDTLVEDLISLAKLEEEKVQLIKTEFSLSDAVSDTLNEFAPAIKNANADFSSDISQNISYNGDEVFVRKLLSILVENAIKYNKGTLKVSLKSNANKKVFRITNSCDNIEIGKHNDWFERFYRADESRNSDTKGFGIGLSVAKSICDKHGAKITAESKTGNEIIISVIF